MRKFGKCGRRIQAGLAGLVVCVSGIVPARAAGETSSQKSAVTTKPTSNPTGLQVGVNPAEAGGLPPGTEEVAKEGALASADMDWEKAKQAYTKLLKMAPENALALSNMGAVEFRLGNLDSALDYLDRATRAAPAIAQNWLTIGLIQHGRGQSYLALSALARALHADPGDPRAHNYMGVVIRGLGWASGAETELQRAIALDPSYADAHFNLAVMYLDRTPPMLELARRHYYASLEYGAKPDGVIEQRLNPAPAVTSVEPVGGDAPVPSGELASPAVQQPMVVQPAVQQPTVLQPAVQQPTVLQPAAPVPNKPVSPVAPRPAGGKPFRKPK